MPVRNWLHHPPVGVLLAVAILLALAGLQNRYGSSEGEQQAAAIEYQQAQVSPQSCDANCEAERSEQRAEDDLQAQQEMARWSFWLFVASLVGVGLLGATLYETRAAAKAAAAMVTESEKATAAVVADRRAWLALSNPEVPRHLRKVGENIVADIVFSAKNVGRSPALDVTFNARIYPLGQGQTVDHRYTHFRSLLERHRFLGPAIFPEGGDVQVIGTHVPMAEINKAATGCAVLQIYYGVGYRLADDDEWHTTINIWALQPIEIDAKQPSGNFGAFGFSIPGHVIKGFAD